MRVLIVGGGGREHALAWKAAQSPLVTRVYAAPGNAGTALEDRVENVPVAADDVNGLAAFAEKHAIDLTIVGPEQPLVGGIVDRFDAAGLRCFGPTRAAARLEGSKAFAKAFLERHSIPTARFASFDAPDPARDYLRGESFPMVIKADGLAAGKGVVIARSREEAERALDDMLNAKRFGEAGRTVVVEEFLRGEEASFIAMVDGRSVVPLASSQDHKTRDDGDRGPNTGGMGAYSPAPVVSDEVHARIMEEIMRPAVEGLLAEGVAYRGFLYAGLMIDERGRPKVLEFNCRFGDPETQPILFRLRSDLVEHCLRACEGRLEDVVPEWDPRPAVGVVIASRGYPERYEKDKPIEGLEGAGDASAKLFHAGTRSAGGRVLTSGGRVLCAVALGADVTAARERAYSLVEAVRFDGAFWRTDIGWRAVAREANAAPGP